MKFQYAAMLSLLSAVAGAGFAKGLPAQATLPGYITAEIDVANPDFRAFVVEGAQ